MQNLHHLSHGDIDVWTRCTFNMLQGPQGAQTQMLFAFGQAAL